MIPGAAWKYVESHHTTEQLQEQARDIRQKRLWRRLQAVILAQPGRTATDIATALGGSLRAVKNWVAQYHRGGITALRERPRSGRPRLLDPEHSPRLRRRLDDPPRPEDGVCARRGLDVRRILREEFGVARGRQAASDLRHRLGSSSLMPRPQPEQANPEVQEVFQEIVVAQSEAIAEAHPDREMRIHCQDAARFGQQGTSTRVWARRGSRPRAVRQNGRPWLDVRMAVCLSTGSVSAVLMPEWDTAVINRLLEQFARELPAGVHAVVIWDGAGDHTGGDLVVPGNVSRIQLPPYSPELNPVENRWPSLRSHHWSNRSYRDYAELEGEAIRSLGVVCGDAEQRKEICKADYVIQQSA